MLGAPLPAPVAAIGPGGRVMMLAGQRLPGEPLGLVAAQLEHVRAVRIDRDPAVEPVAAEVGEPSARPHVRFERVEQLRGRVLGMRTGDHRAVPGQRRRALGVQVVVGEQVGGEPAALEEGEQDQVLGEAVGSAVLGTAVAGTELRQGTPDRCLVDPAAVVVAVVEAAQPVARDPTVLGAGRFELPGRIALARVGEVGEGREQDDVRGRLGAGRPADREGNHVLAPVGGEDHGVDAAREAGRKLELEARLPTEVVGRVGVEVHRRVLIGGAAPIVDVPVPAPPGDPAQRPVDAAAVESVRSPVDDAVARDPPPATRRRPTARRRDRPAPSAPRACRRSGRSRPRRGARRRSAAGPGSDREPPGSPARDRHRTAPRRRGRRRSSRP